MTLPDLIRQRLDALAAAAQTGADALDGAALDLPEGTLASIPAKLDGLAGRLELALDRLGAGVDPARADSVVCVRPPLVPGAGAEGRR
jgi:hypothetical protein